jgi:Raf kinase inhibitor-like YbhB/YbcL family protein
MALTITSQAFGQGDRVPAKYTCEGDDVSPALGWSGAPEGTRAFALIVDDPDAPSGVFTHWLVCDIPADWDGLGESEAPGCTEGTNDFRKVGYGGPCPPRGHGRHRYRFHLHALNRTLGLKRGFSRAELENALRGAVLATATLEGHYERRR